MFPYDPVGDTAGLKRKRIAHVYTMPRVHNFLKLLHNNAIQVVPTTPKAIVVVQPVQKAAMVLVKPADTVTVVYLEHKHFAAAVTQERYDMPRPDALAIALLEEEEYPHKS